MAGRRHRNLSLKSLHLIVSLLEIFCLKQFIHVSELNSTVSLLRMWGQNVSTFIAPLTMILRWPCFDANNPLALHSCKTKKICARLIVGCILPQGKENPN